METLIIFLEMDTFSNIYRTCYDVQKNCEYLVINYDVHMLICIINELIFSRVLNEYYSALFYIPCSYFKVCKSDILAKTCNKKLYFSVI